MNILVAEDDLTLANEIKTFFTVKAFVCHIVESGITCYNVFKTKKFDVVILDINLPGANGIEVCAKIRQIDKKTPILMLTALGEIEDKLGAFKVGADDYLVKPFHFDELFARVNSLLRRKSSPPIIQNEIKLGDLEINLTTYSVVRAGKDINLSRKEYSLLLILANAEGKVVSKQEIAKQLWDFSVQSTQNTIEVYINFLRKKIDKDYPTKLIHTRSGFGYYLKAH